MFFLLAAYGVHPIKASTNKFDLYWSLSQEYCFRKNFSGIHLEFDPIDGF